MVSTFPPLKYSAKIHLRNLSAHAFGQNTPLPLKNSAWCKMSLNVTCPLPIFTSCIAHKNSVTWNMLNFQNMERFLHVSLTLHQKKFLNLFLMER